MGMTYQDVISIFCHDGSTPLFVGVCPEKVTCPEVIGGVIAGPSTIPGCLEGMACHNVIGCRITVSCLNTYLFRWRGEWLKE